MICFCVLAQVSTGTGAEQRQSKAESVLPQCCPLKDQQINPDLWKRVNKCSDFPLLPPGASCLCLGEIIVIRDSSVLSLISLPLHRQTKNYFSIICWEMAGFLSILANPLSFYC